MIDDQMIDAPALDVPAKRIAAVPLKARATSTVRKSAHSATGTVLTNPHNGSITALLPIMGAVLVAFLIGLALALAVGFATPSRANDRPHDPFGNHTIDLNSEAPLFAIWQFLRDQVILDRTKVLACMEQNNSSCPEVSALMKIVQEARQNQGKALLGHLNRSINVMIKAAPSEWIGPLDVLKMKNGDCKSYSIAKYAAVRAAGFSPDHVRGVIVHFQRRHEDHMVTAVYQDDKWFILDNLTNLLLEDLEQGNYEPLAVLDYKGVRRYVSAFSFD